MYLGVSGGWLGHEGGVLASGFSARIRWGKRAFRRHVGTQREVSSLQPGRRIPPQTKNLWLPASRTMRTESLMFVSTQPEGRCYSSLSWLRHSQQYPTVIFSLYTYLPGRGDRRELFSVLTLSVKQKACPWVSVPSSFPSYKSSWPLKNMDLNNVSPLTIRFFSVESALLTWVSHQQIPPTVTGNEKMLFSIRLVSEDAKPRDMRRILKFLESQQSYLDFLLPRVEAPNRSIVEGSAVVLTWLQRMSCSFLLPLPSWNRYLPG